MDNVKDTEQEARPEKQQGTLKKAVFFKRKKASKASKDSKAQKEPKASEKQGKAKAFRRKKAEKETGKAPRRLERKERKNQSGAGDAVKEKKRGFLLFSIRNKIVVCFLVPIVFMIVIGNSAYRKAAEGMNNNFKDSTIQTIAMATDYINMSCTFIESEAMKYAFDSELGKYFLGIYEDKPAEKLQLTTSVKSDIMSSQTSNPFISNIHIITKEGVSILSTQTSTSADGILESHKESVATGKHSIKPWIDSHEVIDEVLSVNRESYILAYEIMSQSNNACIVVDIKGEAIEEFLAGLDLGDGSIIGFITPNGREIICENLPAGGESSLTEGESVFFGQDFFETARESEELEGAFEVSYKGQQYLFIYSRSDKTQATVCALVPFGLITGQAEEIRSITAGLVALATVTVLVVGILIVLGIQNNMKRISRKFGEVAKGDLTVQVKARGRDEFRGLAGSANHMIENTKKLVDKVNHATGQLEVSSEEVEKASEIINDYSMDITQAISEINQGMSKQSEHAQECVAKTDVLSNEIQEVSRVVERVESLVDETESMIAKGIDIVQLLGSRAQETTSITSKVGESIESLRRESEIINTFVGTITDITEQTNLLSLNASIEAARAGEAGRGFAVVAEEIRKLADDSAKAAGEIRNNVQHISAQTMNSVDSANQAKSMVALQSEAVEQVVEVFREMQSCMSQLVEGLKAIAESIEKADKERSDTVLAVKNISDIIEETASSTEVVNDVAGNLLKSVEDLNKTADALGENMQGLKTEISVFKI